MAEEVRKKKKIQVVDLSREAGTKGADDEERMTAAQLEKAAGGLARIDAPNYYASHVRVSLTKWDVRFVFAELLPTSADSIFQIEPKAMVVMSHQHAKSMLEVFTALIEKNAEKLDLQKIYFPNEEAVEAPKDD